ncbi:DUF929 domain-containing protein [Candidatus Marsarchaeota archaeon]|nr:DUF929 domain-containing protein [Candidatus Marsarchaeota archaeon]
MKLAKIGKKNIAIIALLVVAVAAVLFAFYATGRTDAAATAYDNAPLHNAQLRALSLIANNETLANKVSFGNVSGFPININVPKALVFDGKPGVLYFGADYCPYCAITRWSLILALMRFGNFTSLHYMTSNATDVYPNTATFTFFNSSYTSRYINFTSLEQQTNTHKALQTPTREELLLFERFDLNNSLVPQYARGGIPFVDFGNTSVLVGAAISPGIIQNDNWTEVISGLSNPSSKYSQAIVGAANIFTAEICAINNNTPALVCSQAYVQTIQKNLGIKISGKPNSGIA